jgi:hypothetical protein
VLVSPDHQEYFLPKQFRYHFVQIEPPVQPLVTAWSLHCLDPDAMLLAAPRHAHANASQTSAVFIDASTSLR